MLEFPGQRVTLGPLLFDFALGCVFGFWLRSPIIRVCVSPLIAFAVAVACSFQFGNAFVDTGETATTAKMTIIYLFPFGVVVSGAGVLLGFLEQRANGSQRRL